MLQQGRNDEDGREAVQRIGMQEIRMFDIFVMPIQQMIHVCTTAHKAACPIVLSYNIPSHPVEFKVRGMWFCTRKDALCMPPNTLQVALLRRVLAEVTSML